MQQIFRHIYESKQGLGFGLKKYSRLGWVFKFNIRMGNQATQPCKAVFNASIIKFTFKLKLSAPDAYPSPIKAYVKPPATINSSWIRPYLHRKPMLHHALLSL